MACPASPWLVWPTPRCAKPANGCARPSKTAAWTSPPTSASWSTWPQPTCPKTRGVLTCPLPLASWPPAGSWMKSRCGSMCLPASCPCRVSCARCVVPWPWRWAWPQMTRLGPGCCRRAAPKKRPCCRSRGFTGPRICVTWCRLSCLAATRVCWPRQRAGSACSRPHGRSQHPPMAAWICAMCAVRSMPNAPWKSLLQAATAC